MKTMHVSRRMIAGGVLILGLGAVLGCGARQRDAASAAQAHYTVPVAVAVVERKDLSVTKTYSGALEGEEQADIVARLAERVTGIGAHIGESVMPGEVIVALDKSGASSQYYQAEAGFTNAQKTLERMKSLYSDGAISLQTLDGAQTAYDVAKTNFDAAKSVVDLTAPIAGVVTAVNVSVGDLAAPGELLATVARTDRMKITFDIDEVDAATIQVGQKVLVYSDSKPDVKVAGEVISLSKSADSQSRSFEVKARFPNTPDKWFRPGIFCRVDVPVLSSGETLVVPSVAVQSDGVTDRVFVIRGGHAFERTVHVGLSDGQTTAIVDGLAVGDTIATVGASNLKDSVSVNLVTN
ncbi:MAG TPA: efflux RND transporter periplasmic adaptor subunit [bacterium]|nr:efflux RND transporter periplasmic adaptor subunit [bacterium]